MPSAISAPAPPRQAQQLKRQQEECSRHVPLPKKVAAAGECQPLEPPPYGQYYIYSSGPKAVRPNYKGTGKPRGAHDYYCMMWDPRIYRGPTFKTFQIAEKQRCDRKGLEDEAAENNKRKKALAKRRLENQTKQPQGPPTHAVKLGFQDMAIQTDRFLEEITDEVIEKSVCTQTEQIYDMPVDKIYCPIKMGLDVDTQILPWELFSFDEEVKPIVTTVVGKIIEQSLLEIVEESELESLLAQQRAFEERRRMEIMRLHRLRLREQKITEERERLIAQRQVEVEEEKETEGIITASFFSANYLGAVAGNSVDELRRLGFMSGNDDLKNSFIPWLHSRSLRKIGIREKSSVFLDEIIQAVVAKREAEVGEGIWQEVNAAQDNKRLSSVGENNYEEHYGEE